MGINCHLKNEAQEDLQVVCDATGVLSSLVIKGAFKNSQVLRYLDPFGDLILNAAQMEAAAKEIKQVLEGVATNDEKMHLQKLQNLLANTHRRRTHRYMWFIGD